MDSEVVITIAREYGSGGRKIGQKLAGDLNVPFYDKELVAIAAQESGISKELFAKANEKASSSLLYALVMGSYTFGNHVALSSEMPINDKLFSIQSDIIQKKVKEGPCILVGRCADYLLRENKNVLKVFIKASREARMAHVVEEHGVNPQNASEYLKRKDRQRSNYYYFYTKQKWGDPKNYDLIIDSAKFGIEKSAELILFACSALRPAIEK